MTAQVSDRVFSKGDEYSIIGITGELVSPEQFSMTSKMISTACYRGFFATYEITEECLYLREFTLKAKDGNYRPIEGINPVKTGFERTYQNLSVVVPFTGRIKLGRDFVQKLHVNMGFQKATAYKTVLELTLKEGRVIEFKDRSQEINRKRGAFKEHYESGDIGQRIAEAFSLDMGLE
jgi:hypothetical protein